MEHTSRITAQTTYLSDPVSPEEWRHRIHELRRGNRAALDWFISRHGATVLDCLEEDARTAPLSSAFAAARTRVQGPITDLELGELCARIVV